MSCDRQLKIEGICATLYNYHVRPTYRDAFN